MLLVYSKKDLGALMNAPYAIMIRNHLHLMKMIDWP